MISSQVSDLGNNGKCPKFYDEGLYSEGKPCELQTAVLMDITVCSVNDVPVLRVPSSSDLFVTEDEGVLPLKFSVDDVDAAATNATEQIEVEFVLPHNSGEGKLSLSPSAFSHVTICAPNTIDGGCHDITMPGTSLSNWNEVTCDAEGDGEIEPCTNTRLRFRGTLSAMNHVLQLVRFWPNFNSGRCWHLIEVTASDLGNSGECQERGPLRVSRRLGITSATKNKPPVLSLPTAALLGSGREGDLISLDGHFDVTDPDACVMGQCLGLLQATIHVINGKIVFHNCFETDCHLDMEHTGSGWTVSFKANLDVLRFALNNVSFVGESHSSGVDSSISFMVDDGGNSGYGGPQTALRKVQFRSQQVADGPSLHVARPFLIGTAGVPIALDVVTACTDTAETLHFKVFDFTNVTNETQGKLLFRCMRPPKSILCDPVSDSSINSADWGLRVTQRDVERQLFVESLGALHVQLKLEATSVTPDGSDSASTTRKVVIIFAESRNRSHVQPADSQPSLCVDKVRPDSMRNCSQCNSTCLEVSWTVQENGTLVLQERSLLFPVTRNDGALQFFREVTSFRFYLDPPTTLRFLSSSKNGVTDVSVNGHPWESAGSFRSILSLPRDFLQPVAGHEMPAEIIMTVVTIESSDGSSVNVTQLPSTENQYTGVVAFSGQRGSNLSIVLAFDSKDGAIHCCRHGIDYMVGQLSREYSAMSSEHPINLMLGKCIGERFPCRFPSTFEAPARCRFDTVEVDGMTQDNQSLSCGHPGVAISDGTYLREVTVDVKFGDGGWTDSRSSIIFFDVNRPPAVLWRTDQMLVYKGQSTLLPSVAISDPDHVGDLADLEMKAYISVKEGMLVLGNNASKHVTISGTLEMLQSIFQSHLKYQAPPSSFVGETDTVFISVNDLGVAGLGGEQVQNASLDVLVLRSNPWPVLAKRNSRGGTGVISVFEFEGYLQGFEVLSPDAPLPSEIRCRLEAGDVEMSPIYPCVVFIPDLFIMDQNSDGIDDSQMYTVNVSSSSIDGIVGIRDVSGLQVVDNQLQGDHVSFSGTLAQVNLALSRLSFRSIGENSCAEFVSVDVGAALRNPICRNFEGFNQIAEENGAVWVCKEIGRVVSFSQLVFDLSDALPVSRIEFLLNVSDVTHVQVEVGTFYETQAASISPSAFTLHRTLSVLEWTASGEEQVVVHLAKDHKSELVSARYWGIIIRSYSSLDTSLHLSEIAIWYWRTVLDRQTLAVQPVNDAPRFTYSGPSRVSVPEDEWTSLGSIQIQDADASVIADSDISVLIEIPRALGSVMIDDLGTRNPRDISSVITILELSPGKLLLIGTLQGCNRALDKMRFRGPQHFHGMTGIYISVDDRANYGSLGRRMDFLELSIAVQAVNDAPQLRGIPGSLNTREGGLIFFNAASASDPDIDGPYGSAELEVMLVVRCGTGRLTAQCKEVHHVRSQTARCVGTIQVVNAFIESLMYSADSDQHGTDEIVFKLDDFGNLGTGGPLRYIASTSVVVVAVADKPSIVTPDNTCASLSQSNNSGIRDTEKCVDAWKLSSTSTDSQAKQVDGSVIPMCLESLTLVEDLVCAAVLELSINSSIGFFVGPERLMRSSAAAFGNGNQLRFYQGEQIKFKIESPVLGVHSPAIKLIAQEGSAAQFTIALLSSDSDGSEVSLLSFDHVDGLFFSRRVRVKHLDWYPFTVENRTSGGIKDSSALRFYSSSDNLRTAQCLW